MEFTKENDMAKKESGVPVRNVVTDGDSLEAFEMKIRIDKEQEQEQMEVKIPIDELDFPVAGKLVTVTHLARQSLIPKSIIEEVVPFMPHYRVRGIAEPLFKTSEANAWIRQNLIQRIEGDKLPPSQIIVIVDKETPYAVGVPAALGAIQGLRELPTGLFCGIYFLTLNNEVVYVGQSIDIPSRVTNHRISKKTFDRVFFLRVPADHLLEVEKNFIKTLNPKYNQQHIKTKSQSREDAA
jgi:hypothetical protein